MGWSSTGRSVGRFEGIRKVAAEAEGRRGRKERRQKDIGGRREAQRHGDCS